MRRIDIWTRNRGAVLLATSLLASPGARPLPAQSPDSILTAPQPLFSRTDAYYAAGFLAAAAAMAPIDLAVAHELRDSTAQANRFLHGSATGFRWLGNPGAILISTGMYAAGRVSHRPQLTDMGLHTAEALLVAEVTTNVLKTIVGRARPDHDPENPYDLGFGRGFRSHDYASFPSGHTTAAFATAAALSTEIGRIYPHESWLVRPLLYGGAGLVGLSRLYNNEHWASDVVVGAAIGSFAGWKIVRFNHSHPGNRLDRLLLSATIRGAHDGGIRLFWRFSYDPGEERAECEPVAAPRCICHAASVGSTMYTSAP
jgi:membrane-associated phospholipid phosphatase